MQKIGYDISYRKYLNNYKKEFDEFGILIDRDAKTHSEANMMECIRYCKEKGYKCYISNPCFEFWLLLHLSDVKVEYKEYLQDIRDNAKVSANHTFVSREVSKKAHHGKSGISFVKNYLPYVYMAVERAKDFADPEEALVHEIGCNLWKLFNDMKNY